MTTLTIVRHGETDWNRDRRIQGATDIPLNDTGRDQARATGELLAQELDASLPVRVVCSDLSRARETAAIIAEALGADEPRVYPDLRERMYGEAEGILVADFFERFGLAERDAVPGAESRDDLRARGIRALRRVVNDVRRDTGAGGAQIVAVSHGALIRELIGHASGGELPLEGERLANGSHHSFLVERDGLRLMAYTAVV